MSEPKFELWCVKSDRYDATPPERCIDFGDHKGVRGSAAFVYATMLARQVIYPEAVYEIREAKS